MTFQKKINNYIFKAPSRRAYKKYDVYDLSMRYLTSFGDRRFQHFRDRIGYYKKLDHKDPQRRRNYRARHAGDNRLAGKLARKYLW